MARLTERHWACLRFLANKMEASPHRIGEAIAPWRGRTPRGYAIIGGRVARELGYPHHFVAYVPSLKAYAITPAGRQALEEQ